jgi:hypothetical protein
MIKRFYFIFLLGFFSAFSVAQDLKSPSEFLGYEIGTQFTRHSDVVAYFSHVAENSTLVTYHHYGKTNERRPLTYAIVSSENNMRNLETIRTNNLKQIGLESGDAQPETAIVWLSYNVHGNEASSTEAAMQTIYELITEKQSWLENAVIIIDPNLNPDGRDRYVNWYNQVKSAPYDSRQSAAEHNEPWPGGRPNHYLFDLNRDWAWATQVETQQRLKIYNQWMPHIHVDFHEQGINEPYYFAPAAEPFHEIITDWQREFQTQIGKNHAKYFDAEGWLFFTRERFDLLYPSYGDTYPTYMGAIGMTYEQAGHGRAGLGIDTDEGYELTLVDRVAHHTVAGLSTVEIAAQNARQLNREFQKFFNTSGLKYKSFVLKGEQDKIKALTNLLDLHQIKYSFAQSGKVTGYHYGNKTNGTLDAAGALVVSTNQPKGKMVSALFEPEAKLSTPLTYDITAWSLPYAYGLEAVATTALFNASGAAKDTFVNQVANMQAAGYIAKWNSMEDAKFLAALLKADIKVRFTEKPFAIGGQQFERGSLVITKSDNRNNPDFHTVLVAIANTHKRMLYASTTSFSDSGTDFGSPDVKMIHKQRVALLRGKGVSSLNFGAIWHFFEQELHYPVTVLDTDYFKQVELSGFDVLVIPSGFYYSLLDENTMSKLKEWVQKGGKVIAFEYALRAFADKDGFGLKSSKSENSEIENQSLMPYAEREEASVKDFITGSVFKITLDNTHPMAFGYSKNYYTLKANTASYSFLENGYNVGYIDGEAQRMSGFVGEEALKQQKNTVIFGEQRLGRGSMVYFVDDVLFRSFWQNGKLFFANSLFFVNNSVPVL